MKTNKIAGVISTIITFTLLSVTACTNETETVEAPETVKTVTSISVSFAGYSYIHFNDGYLKISPRIGEHAMYHYQSDHFVTRFYGYNDDVLLLQPGDSISFKDGFKYRSTGTHVATIVATYVSMQGKVFQLSNGDQVLLRYNVKDYNDGVVVLDKDGNILSFTSRQGLFLNWQKAKVGYKVKYTTIGYRKLSYAVLMPQDYTRERVVKKVTKYDGAMNKIDGNISIAGGIFSVSGSGKLHGEGMASQNFFINIYFKEGDPISVCAKDNPLFLDIKQGDILIEKCINGVITYTF